MPNKAENRRLTEAIETYRSFRSSHQDGISATEESMNYFLGDQWSNADKRALDKKRLPRLTKNLILPVINRIVGMEISNETDLAVKPTEGGVDEVAWAMTRLNYYFKERGDLNFRLSKMFLLGLVGEMGSYIRPYYTTLHDPLGEIKFNLISGFNVLPDPMRQEYDVDSGKRLIYTTWWTKGDALLRFPDKRKDIENLQEYSSRFMGLLNRTTGKVTDLVQLKDKTELGGRYRVIEMWEKRQTRERLFFDPFSERHFRPKSAREAAEIRFSFPDAIEREMIRTVMWLTITMSDSVLLYDGPAPIQGNRFPFIGYYPYFLDGDFMGVVHNLKGYQAEHNKRSSSILHILMSTANSGWMARKNSIDKEMLEEYGSGLNNVLWWNTEPPEKIQPNQLPSGLVYTDEQAKAGIYETSGVTPNLLGRAEHSRESGALYERRVDEGLLGLQQVFSNYQHTKRILGRYLIWMYQNVLTPERVNSILAEERDPQRGPINEKAVAEITGNMKLGKYDVIVENVAAASSARAKKQDQIAAITRAMPPELVNWPEIIRSTDLPPEEKEKMARYAEVRLGIGNDAVDQAQALLNNQQAG